MRTLVTQSRIDSLIASLSVLLPAETGTTGPPQFHAKDIQFLTPNVFLAHVHVAFEAKQRANSSRSNAMLAGAGFGDNAFFYPCAARANPVQGSY